MNNSKRSQSFKNTANKRFNTQLKFAENEMIKSLTESVSDKGYEVVFKSKKKSYSTKFEIQQALSNECEELSSLAFTKDTKNLDSSFNDGMRTRGIMKILKKNSESIRVSVQTNVQRNNYTKRAKQNYEIEINQILSKFRNYNVKNTKGEDDSKVDNLMKLSKELDEKIQNAKTKLQNSKTENTPQEKIKVLEELRKKYDKNRQHKEQLSKMLLKKNEEGKSLQLHQEKNEAEIEVLRTQYEKMKN